MPASRDVPHRLSRWLPATVFALAACGGAAPPVSSASPPAPAGGRALIIGIDDYAVDERVTRLKGAVNDAEAIKVFAVGSLGFGEGEIRMLTNQDASRAAILAAIDEWLVRGTKPGDRVLFYYAGHGAQQRSDGPDAERGYDQTLVPVDTVVARDGRVRNMITDKELKARFARLAGREVTVIVDACHSGTITRSALGGLPPQSVARTPYRLMEHLQAGERVATRSAMRGAPDLFPRQDGLAVWSAVTSYQVALEDHAGSEPRGVFTRAFLEGIELGRADRDRDGEVSHVELLDWVQERSTAHCRSVPAECIAGLMPTLEAPHALQATPVLARLMGRPLEARRLEAMALADALLPEQAGTIGARPVLRWYGKTGSRPVFALGESMQLEFTSPIDGHLTLFDIQPGGRLVQIFPNAFSAQNATAGQERRVRAGKTFRIPIGQIHNFVLEASKPVGDGMAVAVVTDRWVDFSSVAPATRGARPVADEGEVEDYIETISALLRQPQTLGHVDVQVGWAIATARYRTQQ